MKLAKALQRVVEHFYANLVSRTLAESDISENLFLQL